MDPEATRAGLRVLRRGGNAVDAAVAAAATLGVTEPYSSGIGGGGFFVMYDATSGKVRTLDGRETAPKATRSDTYAGPDLRRGRDQRPVRRCARHAAALGPRAAPVGDAQPGARRCSPRPSVARRGFVVDQTFHDQTAANEARFRDIVPTRKLFLPGGELPAVGSVFRNPDLATTYDKLGTKGVGWLYDGKLGRQIVQHRAGAAEGPGRHPQRAPRPDDPRRPEGATARCRASRPASATAASRCGACRRRRPAGPPSARR